MEQNKPPFTTRELRDAYGSFMTGVTVVTTCSSDGRPLGFTANSFTSVSLDPPLVLVSLAKTSSNFHAFSTAPHFAVNVLSETQKEVSNIFARPSEDRYAHVAWQPGTHGNPLLADASAWFDCATHNVFEAGDHVLLIGRVEQFHSAGYGGLGYYRGAYFTPVSSSTDMIAGPRVVVSVIIAHEDQILLTSSNGRWRLPSQAIGKDGAEKALARLFAQYQPDASANSVYSAYTDTTTDCQHIAFLCAASNDHAKAGQFVRLDAMANGSFDDAAVQSMLERYRKESELKNFGMYIGDHATGTVHPFPL